MKTTLGALIVAATLVTGCATVRNPVTGENERTVMDERSELAEGRKAHQEVLKEYAPLANPAVQAYVNGLGQRLARLSHRNNIEWHFTVLDSPEVNAFALPGGYVYVTRGIMATLNSEADLAGVIGHEIGHVTARHGAQRATRQQTAGIGVLAATILGAVLESRGVSGAGDLAGSVAQGVAARHIASYGREQELQADRLGAEYLARSNYDPKNMVAVIGVLKDQERFADDQARAEGRQPTAHNNWLASHPSNDKRLEDIRQTAATYQGRYGDEGREAYLKIIDGLSYGETRDQGLTRGRHFYHEPLGIALTAPEGWRIQNGRDAIVIASGNGDAGLVVKLLPPDAGRNHEEIIRKVLQPTQGRTEALSLGGFPATHFSGLRRNAQGQAQGIEATIVGGPGNRNYLLAWGARDAATLQRARGRIREAEASFRALTASERAAARPWVIRIVPFPRGGFTQLASQSALGAGAEKQLRLLNGYYGGGEPKAGQKIKTIEF